MLLRFWAFCALLAGGAACLPGAVLYTVTDLGSFGGRYTGAYGINNAGQVTGYFTTAGGAQHAFLYSNGAVTDLGTLPGTTFSGGYGINDAGQITGYSGAFTGHDGISRAFLYSNGVLTDLGTLPGLKYSVGQGINDVGQVTGYCYDASGNFARAFLYSNGVLTDLGTLGGNASSGAAINNAGQIVGASRTASGDSHTFLYSNGVLTDVNDLIDPNLHITLGGAAGINDNGQILTGRYLLTPVPEPGTWLLLGAGLLLVAVLTRSYNR